MRCISAAYMPSCGVCLCVRVSVTFVSCVKTNKDIFEIFSSLGSQAILVFFHAKRDGDIPTGTPPPNGGVECRWGRQKTRFWTNIWLRCIQDYSVVNRTSREVSKTKPRRTAASVEHSPRRPSSAQDDDEVFVTGSTLYAGEEVNPPGHNPLGHNPVFCCRRTS